MTDVFVTVDSRHREKQTDGPGDYTVRLQSDLRGVGSVSVRSADIPPMWNIPKGRSSIWVSSSQFTSIVKEVVIEPGDYTPDVLAAALKASLHEASGNKHNPASITVGVTPLGRFEITMPFSFSIDGGHPGRSKEDMERDSYGPSSAGRVLGMRPGIQAAKQNLNDWTFTAPHVHQLGKPEPVYLHIEDYDAVHGVTAGQIGCTEVIRAGGKMHEQCAVRTFVPPLHRISRLRVRITDHYGQVVDFDNRDHIIELVFNVHDRC